VVPAGAYLRTYSKRRVFRPAAKSLECGRRHRQTMLGALWMYGSPMSADHAWMDWLPGHVRLGRDRDGWPREVLREGPRRSGERTPEKPWAGPTPEKELGGPDPWARPVDTPPASGPLRGGTAYTSRDMGGERGAPVTPSTPLCAN
jgi:hypothetical protein